MMTLEIEQRIYSAAKAAYRAAWARFTSRSGPDWDPPDWPSEVFRFTVAERCALEGVDERDFYQANLDVAEIFAPEHLTGLADEVNAATEFARLADGAERVAGDYEADFGALYGSDQRVGEIDVNDADWRFAPPELSPVPEREPEPGSWIARNLPAPSAVVVPDGYEPDAPTVDEDEAEQLAYDRGEEGVEPYVGMADAAGPRSSYADRAGTASHERDAGDLLQDWIEAGDEEAEDEVDDAVWGDHYRSIPERGRGPWRPPAAEPWQPHVDAGLAASAASTARRPDADGVLDRSDELLADTGVGVPERHPDPGSWIDRNLPDTVRGMVDASASAELEAAERARVWDAVNSLPEGVVTDGDLDRAGITRDEFNRVSRDAARRVDAEEQAQLEAEREQAWRRESDASHERAEAVHRLEVARCGHAVREATEAVHRLEVAEEDTARAERLARWNAEDQAATRSESVEHDRGLW